MRLEEQIVIRVMALMDWDTARATAWCGADNPFLGGVSPLLMCMAGRASHVLALLEQSEHEQERDTVSQPDRPPRSPEHPRSR